MKKLLPCGHKPLVDEEYAYSQYGDRWASVPKKDLTYYCEECDQPYMWDSEKKIWVEI